MNNNCNSDSTNTKPYTIEKPASDRPLEAYAVGRIYQLEAQVEDQKNRIVQLEGTLDQIAGDYRVLMDILKPEVKLTSDGGMRRIDLDGVPVEYCKYSRDKYYKLVSFLGLQKENYQACLQEYENEIRNGTETDLSDDERSIAKNNLLCKSKSNEQSNEGGDGHAD